MLLVVIVCITLVSTKQSLVIFNFPLVFNISFSFDEIYE